MDLGKDDIEVNKKEETKTKSWKQLSLWRRTKAWRGRYPFFPLSLTYFDFLNYVHLLVSENCLIIEWSGTTWINTDKISKKILGKKIENCRLLVHYWHLCIKFKNRKPKQSGKGTKLFQTRTLFTSNDTMDKWLTSSSPPFFNV